MLARLPCSNRIRSIRSTKGVQNKSTMGVSLFGQAETAGPAALEKASIVPLLRSEH